MYRRVLLKNQYLEVLYDYVRVFIGPSLVIFAYWLFYFVFIVRRVYPAVQRYNMLDFLLVLGPFHYLLLLIPSIPVLVVLFLSSKVLVTPTERTDIVEKNTRILKKYGMLLSALVFGWWLWYLFLLSRDIPTAYGPEALPAAATTTMLFFLGALHTNVIYVLWETLIMDKYLEKARIFEIKQRINSTYWKKLVLISFGMPLILGIITFGAWSAGVAGIRATLEVNSSVDVDSLMNMYRELTRLAALWFVTTYLFYGIILVMLLPFFHKKISKLMNHFQQLTEGVERPRVRPDGDATVNAKHMAPILRKMPLPAADEIGVTYGHFNRFISILHDNVSEILARQQSLRQFFDELVEEFKEVNAISQDIAATVSGVTEASQRQADLLESLTDKVEQIKTHFTTLLKDVTALGKEFTAITRQIQVVSFNATIEAARAGEHGKGFMVVADTIRNLNTQAQNLHERLRTHIEESLQNFNTELNQIVDATREVGSISEENAASAEEVNASVEEETATIQSLYDQTTRAKEIIMDINNLLAAYKDLGEV